jgi:hypothetical protein
MARSGSRELYPRSAPPPRRYPRRIGSPWAFTLPSRGLATHGARPLPGTAPPGDTPTYCLPRMLPNGLGTPGDLTTGSDSSMFAPWGLAPVRCYSRGSAPRTSSPVPSPPRLSKSIALPSLAIDTSGLPP